MIVNDDHHFQKRYCKLEDLQDYLRGPDVFSTMNVGSFWGVCGQSQRWKWTCSCTLGRVLGACRRIPQHHIEIISTLHLSAIHPYTQWSFRVWFLCTCFSSMEIKCAFLWVSSLQIPYPRLQRSWGLVDEGTQSPQPVANEVKYQRCDRLCIETGSHLCYVLTIYVKSIEVTELDECIHIDLHMCGLVKCAILDLGGRWTKKITISHWYVKNPEQYEKAMWVVWFWDNASQL